MEFKLTRTFLQALHSRLYPRHNEIRQRKENVWICGFSVKSDVHSHLLMLTSMFWCIAFSWNLSENGCFSGSDGNWILERSHADSNISCLLRLRHRERVENESLEIEQSPTESELFCQYINILGKGQNSENKFLREEKWLPRNEIIQ